MLEIIFAKSLQLLIGTALICVMLAQVPYPVGAAGAARATSPIAAAAGDAAAAGQAIAQQQGGSGLCGWIGVQVSPMTRAFADSLGMTEPYGAIFGRPKPGSPAAKAGIESYDVITAINGSPLRSWSDFAKIISSMAPNTRVYLTTWRSRQLLEVRVILGSAACPRRSWLTRHG